MVVNGVGIPVTDETPHTNSQRRSRMHGDYCHKRTFSRSFYRLRRNELCGAAVAQKRDGAWEHGQKVADIKRVNNFIREQDLYALKSIKIPVKTHGLLTENGRELRPLPTAPSQTGLTLVDLPEPDDGASSSADGRHLSDYFKGIDKSIQDVVQAEVQLNAEYCMEALERPLPQSGKQETSNGADCGIQWWNAVFIMLLIGIVLPVFYIIYFKTQGLVAHTSNTTLTSNISTDGLEGKLPQSSVVEEKS
ncbi:lysM and putative peptidoglycan-binding domain-containing protein 4 isoform X2 [Calonectris borealis]|uniref:lysM and putative peptidoglycan-binding domain-containing protein 4 isoform X2 n=1 Tax=Calonectris borealis TaxID=1323832 RepID=UPI003F4C1E22